MYCPSEYLVWQKPTLRFNHFLGEAANSADESRFFVPGAEMPKRDFSVGQGYARFVGIDGK